MKRTLLATAGGLLIHSAVLAQYTAPTPGVAASTAQKEARAQQLLSEYIAKFRNNASEGRKLLDELYVNRLAKTADNVKTVRALLASTVTSEEKVGLARILGKLYTKENATGMNVAIANDLRGLTQSGQTDVARAATFTFSRLGYFPDSAEVLASAKNRGLIDDEAFFGELAHIAPSAPGNDQVNLLSKIRAGKSRYGADVLAYQIQETGSMKKFSSEAKVQLLYTLAENEPGFPVMAIGEYDLSDGIRYSTWLHAVATLERDTKHITYQDVVMARLGNEKIDPRKIMAFLSSTEGKRLIKDVGRRGPFESLHERITLYSKQLPQNQIMKEVVAEITATLSALKQ